MGRKGGSDGVLLGVLIGAVGVSLLKNASRGVLEQMREHILRDQTDPEVRGLAFQIVDGTSPRDALGRLGRIYSWVTENLEWKPDPASADRAASIKETLGLRGGDCDCLTTAFCTLAEAAGHRTWLLTAPKNDPTHVMATVPVSVDSAQVLRERHGCVILQMMNGRRRALWLPYDPSLRPGRPGALGEQTYQQARGGDFRIHAVKTMR